MHLAQSRPSAKTTFGDAVVRRIGKQRKYETGYPGERPADHDLRSEEYGPGGWTDEQQQIWIVIVKDSR